MSIEQIIRLGGVALLCAAACAPKKAEKDSSLVSEEPDSSNGKNGGEDDAGSAADAGTGPDPDSRPSGGGGDLGGSFTPEDPPEAEPCASDDRVGQQIPLDMLIMMDRSGSMIGLPDNGPNVWIPISEALDTFVSHPGAEGLGVGIQFFPPAAGDFCDVGNYSVAAAPIATLPGNASVIQQAIANSPPVAGQQGAPQGGQGGRGGTPTLPALQGAVEHARNWGVQTGHKVVVVLATDGEPNVCNSTIPAVADAASLGLSETPPTETYVIGIGNIAGLNEIALAGGTDHALIVAADPAVASQQFLDAMDAIRGTAQIPCELQIPEAPAGQVLDYSKVRVAFATSGSSSEIFAVDGEAQCDPNLGGWYYDEPANPSRVVLCPATCDVIETQKEAELNIGIGCEPRRISQ